MRTILYLLFGLTIIFAQAACSPTNHGPSSGTTVESDEAPKGNTVKENKVIPIRIIVGGSTFTATLNNNETTQALVAQFPMTLQMNELNGLEKYNDLSEALPSASPERPATIHAGDIMCWSGNTLVLFYHTFSNSYDGYVPLGSVDDPANLAAALGSGSVQVTWSLAE
ncbi:cyclophilin-like fold protein [Paenibacillus ihuae]|uniref:cyclophilin-like fold protein n=1 Tax=Paenibacillus ihuae TaxID=1232431 RepID=UPI0006D53B22|nr:cyclophilin-like fold protein [Paenibacillus ihuae]